MKLALLVALAAAGALAGGTIALAKGDARARLTTPFPIHAQAGTTLRVTWTVDVPGAQGRRVPFRAQQMFVRLLSASGAPAATAFTDTRGGANAAIVTVPEGGLGGIPIGLRGTTDVLFPLVNDPFVARGGVRCDVAAFRATIGAFVRAYAAGDLRRLDRLFSRRNFVWYSATAPGARFTPEANDRASLVPYFRNRHRQRDEIRVTAYRFGYDRDRALGHFGFSGQRRADDARGGDWFPIEGKGALDCSRRPATIAVLSFGSAG